ncbi:hypothetical protein ZEAMMB73_Zm00001d037448 [Zea mays]|uniref:Uncharacterized protein n=1 Tax=Zea mays TaxID=4577 RepID=A0A1D6LXX1_MAIZE|nr:hypothetical protein ZEAMMB73_Zm00001d037448 [Zea mays]AQK83999.1 hypothetical protein ZEAMMB73_Zm00001d037448 [Zea mays]AQK84000.1 hypothetical protein ZEAMMB73_Zm00001d037448 [Zea mays]AQK84002.1 hypothetical protein ZEAMMB73_Zm00001d037448 [Zea mays]AQK84004.1 hypothetical protein ZEAMMB73_Zm00001d037448 [Zea mays]
MEPFRVAPSMCSTKVGSMNGLANRDVWRRQISRI